MENVEAAVYLRHPVIDKHDPYVFFVAPVNPHSGDAIDFVDRGYAALSFDF